MHIYTGINLKFGKALDIRIDVIHYGTATREDPHIHIQSLTLEVESGISGSDAITGGFTTLSNPVIRQ